MSTFWSDSTRPADARSVLDSPRSRPQVIKETSRAASPSALSPCTRPARFIILRCGSVQSFFFVSSRMFAHSRATADGGSRAWRSRAPSVPPAAVRPSSPGFPLLAGQPVPQRVTR